MEHRKLKIAFLNIYNGVIDRGAETFVKEVASRLTDKYSVSVFQAGEVIGTEKYRVVRLPVNWDWSKKSGVGTLAAKFFVDYWNREIFSFAVKASPRIFKERFDIVIPVNGGWLPAVMRIVTWLIGGKMIVSGQSGMGWDDRVNLYSLPNYFIPISSEALKWAKEVNPFIKSVYIPNGVDTKKFKPEACLRRQGEKIEIGLKKPIILCIGALTKTKRIDLVIKAVSKLEDVSLLVVGKGEEEKNLQDLGDRLLKGRFKIMSFPYEKMPEVYRAADIFTLVSEPYYSFENVLVEAMATNIPVVANNDSIRREIVGDGGLLVDPTNIDEYRKTIKKTLNINWGNRPRTQAIKFDWDKIAKKYEELITKL